MSNRTHVIDGVTYVEVDRQAEVGDKIYSDWSNTIYTVEDVNETLAMITNPRQHGFYHGSYAVVVEVGEACEGPTVDTSQANPQVIDMLANLARRVTSLEAQLRDTQRNVETWAELTATNEQDIAMLDNRTYSLTAVQSAEGILNEIERLLKRRGDHQ